MPKWPLFALFQFGHMSDHCFALVIDFLEGGTGLIWGNTGTLQHISALVVGAMRGLKFIYVQLLERNCWDFASVQL